ncbi:MAG TPA: error-prone DNA polymerase [Opitutaceae bacterium]|nr:error-prone DNA polymerase [Lacunisphaera sp.]HWA10460.1 error-prone DNA polymerase [Opitutaceae bacterium]
MAYTELHARSAFSFLRGGSDPDALGRAAGHCHLPALALCDRNGVYGAVRLHMAAKEHGFRALVGCELVMEDDTVVPVIVATKDGYHGLCELLTTAHLRSAKGEGRVRWSELAVANGGLIALTGDEEGPVRHAWLRRGANAADAAGQKLMRIFGPDRLCVELQRHLLLDEEEQNDFLIDWARMNGLPLVATNGVTHATPRARNVADIFTCVRAHTTLDKAGRRLARNGERHVKGHAAMAALFSDLPEAITNTERIAERIAFTIDQLGYQFPDFDRVPHGQTQIEYLRRMTYFGAQQRYGSIVGDVESQLQRELALIDKLGFSGYFLIVWDLCAFARESGIMVQGRGSAANSAVCYALGITAVDPVGRKLLFERFLSEGRTDWPDIDLDLPSGDDRERVIQHVYERYGRRGAAMTANVISLRGKSTMREVGKAFGLPEDVLDRFSSLFHSGDYPQTVETKQQLKAAGFTDDARLEVLLDTCQQVYALPRHLGQHSGGMVLSAGNLSRFVPLENASMPGRSVLQWDKTDCEDLGLVKIDLLGLGMVAALQDAAKICAARKEPVDFARIPTDDPAVFKMMQEADTVGCFQIESRAQMATLPRMRPQTFYDVAIQVAIIRPGPIQGDAVNPYLERRNGRQPVTYPDERTRPILERTLGVVLFQEQILRIAMDLGGFSAAEADELRRAIGFTRSDERLNRMKDKLAVAMSRNGVSAEASAYILKSLASFALYGFPESHALSFALIAYASAWMKVHRPAAFYVGIINNMPMGFYSVASLIQDGKRHGLRFLPPCIERSDEDSRVDSTDTIRLGLKTVRGLRQKTIRDAVATRQKAPFHSLEDFLQRTRFNPTERRALALIGALNGLSAHRRAALWRVEAQDVDDELFRGVPIENEMSLSPLEMMTHIERLRADYSSLGFTVGAHPMALARPYLPDALPAETLKTTRAGARVKIAGSVACRQRPGTAKGFVFVTLEDETGTANAIIRPQLFERERLVINLEPALVITGRLQNEQGVIHVMAEEIAGLPTLGLPEQASHNYH